SFPDSAVAHSSPLSLHDALPISSIVVVPVAASASRLRPAEFYADLARIIRRGESIDTESLLQHLNSVGYNSTDVVEMPGEYALRDRKSTRLNSSHVAISYAVFCL